MGSGCRCLLLPPCPAGFGPKPLAVGGHQLGLLLCSHGTLRLVGLVLPSILLELTPGKRKTPQKQLPAAAELLNPGSVCGHGVAWPGKPWTGLWQSFSLPENISQPGWGDVWGLLPLGSLGNASSAATARLGMEPWPAWECNHSLGMKPCPGWE